MKKSIVFILLFLLMVSDSIIAGTDVSSYVVVLSDYWHSKNEEYDVTIGSGAISIKKRDHNEIHKDIIEKKLTACFRAGYGKWQAVSPNKEYILTITEGADVGTFSKARIKNARTQEDIAELILDNHVKDFAWSADSKSFIILEEKSRISETDSLLKYVSPPVRMCTFYLTYYEIPTKKRMCRVVNTEEFKNARGIILET